MSEATAKGRSRPGRYVVAQMDDAWHVMFEPEDLPHHYVSVARFQEFRRAKNYAEMEDMWAGDTDGHGVLPDAGSLPKIPVSEIAVTKKPIVPAQPAPKSNLKRPMSPLENEIVGDLRQLMKTHPKGVSVSDLMEWYGEGQEAIEIAVAALIDRKQAILRSWPDSKLKRIVPPNYSRPDIEPSDDQASLMQAMAELAENGEVSVSQKMLSEISGVHASRIAATVGMLIGRGLIKRTSAGGPQIAASYRILPAPEAPLAS